MRSSCWAAATASAIGDDAWSLAQDVRDPESHRAVARAATARGPRPLRIVHIEDDPNNQRLFEAALRRRVNVELHVAPTALEGLAVAAHDRLEHGIGRVWNADFRRNFAHWLMAGLAA